MEFIEFPKMARLSRECIITEKIDGTSATVYIANIDGDYQAEGRAIFQKDDLALYVGSRNRWIHPNDDNYGFARWCQDHAEELLQLGHGWHRGEWWGKGIQRGYGLTEKRWSLFNTRRWCLAGTEPRQISTQDPRIFKTQEVLPSCCHLVPELYRGWFDTNIIELELDLLDSNGSFAASGFMRPEGIVVYHTAGNVSFKKTLGNDGAKGAKP